MKTFPSYGRLTEALRNLPLSRKAGFLALGHEPAHKPVISSADANSATVPVRV